MAKKKKILLDQSAFTAIERGYFMICGHGFEMEKDQTITVEWYLWKDKKKGKKRRLKCLCY